MVEQPEPQVQRKKRVFSELSRKRKRTTVSISTSKKSKEEIKLGNYVPPEGHSAFFVHLDSARACLISFGGVSFKDQVSTSDEAALIIISEFSWDEDLVSKYDDLIIIPPIKMALTQPARSMKGSLFLGLCGSASAIVKIDGADVDFLVHGGQSTYNNQTTDFVFKISTNCNAKSKKKTTCMAYLPPSTKNPDDAKLQAGDIPKSRMSHTMTAISSEEFIIIGGFHTNSQCQQSSLYDSAFRLTLTDDTASWKRLQLPQNSGLQGIFGHAACLLPNGKIAIVGGAASVDGNFLFHNALEPVIVDVFADHILESPLSLQPALNKPLVDHSLCNEGFKIFCFGGHVYEQTSSEFLALDIEAKTYEVDNSPPASAATYGGSMFLFGENNPKNIILVGGSSDSIYLCSHGDTVSNSPCSMDETCLVNTKGLSMESERLVECTIQGCLSQVHIKCDNRLKYQLKQIQKKNFRYKCPLPHGGQC